MKRRIIEILAVMSLTVFVALPSSAQESAGVLRLTLDDALAIALSENLTVKVADQEITRQEYAKRGAYSALFPQISIDGTYARAIEKQTLYMDMGAMGMPSGAPGAPGEPGAPENNEGPTAMKVGQDNSWSGGVTASMPLVSAPLWKSLEISALDVELAVEKARSSRIEMVDQVKRAFYTVLLAGDSHRVYTDAYVNARNNYDDIKAKFDRGLVAEYDVIRARVNVSNAEPSVYDAENSLALALWQLKALIGIDLATEIECAGVLADYDRQLSSGFPAMDLSLGDNSDLKQIDIQLDQQSKVIQLQKAQYLPTLNAQFSYQYTAMNNNFKFGTYKWDPYSMLGLSLSIPVFSGGQRHSNLRQAQIGLSQLQTVRQDAERNLQLAVKQSYDRMNTCHKQYMAAKEGVGQSETGYKITMKRYETGEGTLLEINDSQLSLTVAKLNLNQAIYNYLVARSSLEKILGNNNQ